MDIKEETFVTWHEAKKTLEKKEKEKELGYEQKSALDYFRKFSKLSESKAKAMEEKLKEITKLKDRQIAIILNMLPQDEEDLRVLFSSEIIQLSPEEKKKIISVVKSHS